MTTTTKETERGKEIRLARAKLCKKHLKYLLKNPEKMAEEAYFEKNGKRMPTPEHRPYKDPDKIEVKCISKEECEECNT